MRGARLGLAVASVGLTLAAVGVAIAYGPRSTAVWMVIVGIGVAAFAIQGVLSDPSDLTLALLLSAAPLLGLLGEGGSPALIGPLAVLLLLAGELNALSWASQGHGGLDAVGRRRLMHAFQVAGLAFVVAVVVTAMGRVWVSGHGMAFVLGVAGLAGLAALVYGHPGTGASAPVGRREDIHEPP